MLSNDELNQTMSTAGIFFRHPPSSFPMEIQCICHKQCSFITHSLHNCLTYILLIVLIGCGPRRKNGCHALCTTLLS